MLKCCLIIQSKCPLLLFYPWLTKTSKITAYWFAVKEKV
uniref:Uncharacterized protein n=1 Tax=Rhizophora mucronata TaxID=61149 RepID=A0A2P2QE66_RHIMU